MVEGCGANCLKYILFIFNFLFFLVGAVAVGLGIWILVDKNYMDTLSKVASDPKIQDYNVPGLLQSGAIVMIVGGGILLFMGFLGCCGAVKEIKCLLVVYAGLLILILIVEIVAGILAAIMKGKFESELQTNLKSNLYKNYDGKLNGSDIFSRALDWSQVYFDCCGIDSYEEYKNASAWTENKTKVPITCCMLVDKNVFLDGKTPTMKDTNCPDAPTDGNSYIKTPCYAKIRKWLVDRAVIVIGIAFGIVGLELFGIIFACCLIRAIKE